MTSARGSTAARTLYERGKTMNFDIGPIEAPTVRELFTQKLAGLIMNGDLKAGEQLPSERELASQAKISKSAVHLALVDLERMGFVETRVRQGTYVTDFRRYGNVNTLDLLTQQKGFEYDTRNIIDILEMRDGIESKALERLADNLTEDNVKILRDDLEETQNYANGEVDISVLAQKFFTFHHDVCFCSGNFVLPLLFNTFKSSTTYFWEQPIREFGVDKCMKYMQGMYDAIMTGDAEKSKAFLQNELETYKRELSK